MARRSVWVQIQREAEQRRREAERAARALERERVRLQREAERKRAYDEKEQKEVYLKQRTSAAQQRTDEITRFVDELDGLLAASLAKKASLDFEMLREQPTLLEFEPGTLATPIEPPSLVLPVPPSGLERLRPGSKAKHAQAVSDAEASYAEALAQAVQAERERRDALADAEHEHEERVGAEGERVAVHNSEVDTFKERYEEGNAEAVITYCSTVLAAGRYPENFPQEHKVAYVPESRQLVIELDLPTYEVVPEALEYRYVKAKDQIASKARPATQRRALYTKVVSQVTLRTVHEMFGADQAGPSNRLSSMDMSTRSIHVPADPRNRA
jgi:restriction system protein